MYIYPTSDQFLGYLLDNNGHVPTLYAAVPFARANILGLWKIYWVAESYPPCCHSS